MIKRYLAESLNDYINMITAINKGYRVKWFRGQSKSSYRLLPSALRLTYAVEDRFGNKLNPPVLDSPCSESQSVLAYLPVDRMVEEFKSKAQNYIEYDAETMIEWECIAQHYGLPTRMLDWTANAISALFFVVDNKYSGESLDAKAKKRLDIETEDDYFDYMEDNDLSGTVYMIDPLKINKRAFPFEKSGNKPMIFDAVRDSKFLEEYLHSYLPPICFSGFNKEKRIARQAGAFSLTSSFLWPLDYYTALEDCITKIIIPHSSYEAIRQQLRSLGITHRTMYVETNDSKDLMARKIAKETKERFISEITKS